MDLVGARKGREDGLGWSGGEVGRDGEVEGSKMSVGEMGGERVGGRETSGRLGREGSEEEEEESAFPIR